MVSGETNKSIQKTVIIGICIIAVIAVVVLILYLCLHKESRYDSFTDVNDVSKEDVYNIPEVKDILSEYNIQGMDKLEEAYSSDTHLTYICVKEDGSQIIIDIERSGNKIISYVIADDENEGDPPVYD